MQIKNRSINAVIVILLFLMGFLLSCKKFLDKKMNTSINTPVSVSDLQALLDDAEIIMNNKGTPTFTEASSDDYMLLPGMYEQITDRPRIQAVYRWQPYEYVYPNDWSDAYGAIYNANYCLETIEKNTETPGNITQWKNVKGSALFFRAYYFLHMIWTYGKAFDEADSHQDPGIVLRLESDFNVPSKRASVKDCYEQILNDTKTSIDLLPPIAAHPYRPSKAAAYGLLARTYLSMRMYDSAYKYADLCLGLKNELIDLNGDNDLGVITANYPFKKFNKETIFHTVMGGNGTVTLTLTSRVCLDTALYKTYKDNDLRKTAYFRLSSGMPLFKGSYSQSNRLFSGMATDEIYLIRAECYLKKKEKNIELALADLNMLLKHRYKKESFVPVTTTAIGSALSAVMEERRKELVFRGLRWIDLKRLNKEGANIVPRRVTSEGVFELPANSAYYALPLPYDIISLAGIAQNSY